jgi:CBS domain-containing protein
MNFFLDRLTAEEFMAYEPITISPDAGIGEAARLILQHQIGGLPVMEDNELVGIITETDLCRLLILQADSAPGLDPGRDQEKIDIIAMSDRAR